MRFDDVDNDLVKIKGQVQAAGGEIVQLRGRVLDAEGQPLAGARVEIWQCGPNGRYRDADSTAPTDGFRGFGAIRTDSDGNYRFRTIRPVASCASRKGIPRPAR